jgi:hypothetical protein
MLRSGRELQKLASQLPATIMTPIPFRFSSASLGGGGPRVVRRGVPGCRMMCETTDMSFRTCFSHRVGCFMRRRDLHRKPHCVDVDLGMS